MQKILLFRAGIPRNGCLVSFARRPCWRRVASSNFGSSEDDMPAKSGNRKILLVGSVPLANAKEVFSESAARLGELIPRIPDGETGVRTMWILCQKEVMAKTKNLKMHHQFDIAPGVAQTVYEVADHSKPAEFPALNYAAAAKDSYRQFTELKKAGKIAATTKFQVSLPTAVAVLSGFIVPESQALVEKPYTEALKKEVDEIAQAIPHQELAIQWDVADEVLFLAGWQLETFVDRSKEGLLRRIVDLGNAVPSDIDLGFHLCYGDPGHKHLVEPTDLGLSVELANVIVERSSRPVQWIHMPVPRDRKDDAYFEPLKKLRLPPTTELYLGLVHLTDGAAGARSRVETAKRYRPEFGVACECGFGRRNPETILPLLDLHREVAAL
jgi:hypothetical protein